MSPSVSLADVPVAPFEGPEKLLEIWFADDSKQCGEGLLTVSRETWETMLDLVRCRVLSVLKGKGVHAYLLSESSMFVYAHKIILKTCGTTTLLLGLKRLLEISKDACGSDQVLRLFYSRKTFMFPEKQEGPHKDWSTEVKFLDGMFDNGSAYTVGRMNGDHWLLYLTTPPLPPLASPVSPSQPTPLSDLMANGLHIKTSLRAQDQTLEILMSDLDTQHCFNFFQPPLSPLLQPSDPSVTPASNSSDFSQGHHLGSQVSKLLAIDQICDTTTFKTSLDSFLFEPCGYSANALISPLNAPSDSDHEDFYYSIHVTPSPPSHTYASFETNQTFTSITHIEETINRVVSIFKPGRIVVTWFVEVGEGNDLDWRKVKLEGFGKREKIGYEFEGYDLMFNTWERLPVAQDTVIRVQALSDR